MNMPNRASRHQAMRRSRVFIDSRHQAISGEFLSTLKSAGGCTESAATTIDAPTRVKTSMLKPNLNLIHPPLKLFQDERMFDSHRCQHNRSIKTVPVPVLSGPSRFYQAR